jgi:hypothetical protein
VTVITTDRRVGACIFIAAVAVACAGGLVDFRGGAGANDAWALATLVVGAEEGPATGEGEVVCAETCASFVGTLRTSGGWVFGEGLDVEAWGGDWCAAGGTLSLIFPLDGRCESLGVYCGTA